MCCGNKARRQRQPLVLNLGQFAYKKYQERREQQQSLAAGPADHRLERRSSPPPHVLEREANGEILEKAGIAPPSYDAVVGQSPGSFHFEKRTSSGNRNNSSDEDAYEDADLSDAESFFELDGEGKRQGSAELSAAQAEFIRSWRANRGLLLDEPEAGARPALSKWQQKRAERAVRKAERAARRADRAAMGL